MLQAVSRFGDGHYHYGALVGGDWPAAASDPGPDRLSEPAKDAAGPSPRDEALATALAWARENMPPSRDRASTVSTVLNEGWVVVEGIDRSEFAQYFGATKPQVLRATSSDQLSIQ